MQVVFVQFLAFILNAAIYKRKNLTAHEQKQKKKEKKKQQHSEK